MVPCWNKIILGRRPTGLKFFKIIIFWHGTTALTRWKFKSAVKILCGSCGSLVFCYRRHNMDSRLSVLRPRPKPQLEDPRQRLRSMFAGSRARSKPCSVIIRPHRRTTYVDAAYCWRWSSVVCLSVCPSVCVRAVYMAVYGPCTRIAMKFNPSNPTHN